MTTFKIKLIMYEISFVRNLSFKKQAKKQKSPKLNHSFLNI